MRLAGSTMWNKPSYEDVSLSSGQKVNKDADYLGPPPGFSLPAPLSWFTFSRSVLRQPIDYKQT
jgi:hypothetical protein